MDRDGNKSLAENIVGFIKGVIDVGKNIAGACKLPTKSKLVTLKNNLATNIANIISNIFGTTSGKDGGSSNVTWPQKIIRAIAKCATNDKIFMAGVETTVKVLPYVEQIFDTAVRIGAVIVFAAGAIAYAGSLALALPQLAVMTVLGTSIGTIVSAVGGFALYGGIVTMSLSGMQIISGLSGYRIDGRRLTEDQAKARFYNGMTNLSLSIVGGTLGGGANNNANQGAGGAGSSIRDKLLGKVENPKLKNAINEIYRPGATTGDGGLADAVRHELSTGELVGGKSHIQKAMERVTNLDNIIKKQSLSSGDLDIANKLLDDLKNALGGK